MSTLCPDMKGITEEQRAEIAASVARWWQGLDEKERADQEAMGRHGFPDIPSYWCHWYELAEIQRMHDEEHLAERKK